MHAHLPRTMSLIKDSWSAFIQTWDVTVRYSAWMILISVIQVLPTVIPFPQPEYELVATIVAVAIGVAIGLWATNALYLATLALEKKEHVTPKTTAPAIMLIWPLLLIELLNGIATLGAALFFILPGIYVAIRLGFGQLELYSKGLRGRDALKASWNLTQNKFWAIAGRWAAGGLVFGLFSLAIMALAVFIVQVVAGNELAAAMKEENNATGNAAFSIISGIVQAAVLPLFVVFEVKLYRALEHTRSS